MKRSSTARVERLDDDGLDVDLTKLRVVGRGLYAKKRVGLRSLREASGITQVDMAERMGVTQAQVSKIETGEDHRVSTLERYAEALGGRLVVAVVVGGRQYCVG
jgi:DNA-binding XRE family transcriptional regulator